MTLKVDVFEIWKDVDHLKSIDINSLFGMVETLDDPSADVPACAEVSPATTGDNTRDDVAVVESEAETYEEQLEVRYAAAYEDLTDLEGVMFGTTRQASLRDTSMVSSSGAEDDETPSTDAQPMSVAQALIPRWSN